MAKRKGITIGLEFDDKSKLKLRAIAKHVGALADELDRIDNLKECVACGSYNATTTTLTDGNTHKVLSAIRKCEDCGNEIPTQLKEATVSIGITNSKSAEDIANALKDLPTRLEGSQ